MRTNGIQVLLAAVIVGLLLVSCQDKKQGPSKKTPEQQTTAALAAKSRGPFYFVVLPIEPSIAGSKDITVVITPINLPQDFERDPFIKLGETWWLGSPDGIWQVTCNGTRKRRGLEVVLSSATPVLGNRWLLSKDPLPPQTWQQREIEAEGIALRVIVFAGGDQYLLDSVQLPGKLQEGDSATQYRIDISQKKKGDADWTRIASFRTEGGEARPFLDVDGDGVPEIITSEWYGPTILRKFSPTVETIAIQQSEV